MTRGFLIAGAMALVLAEMQPNARARPDFSGTWVLVDPIGSSTFGSFGKSFTVTQDAATLSLDFPAASFSHQDSGSSSTTPSGRRLVFNLDGTDVRAAIPAEVPRPPNAPATLMTATLVASVARAAWNGDQLIIVTHSTMKVTSPSQWPAALDRENTVREALSLDANGHLIFERVIIEDPLPWETTMRVDLPISWNGIYKKAP